MAQGPEQNSAVTVNEQEQAIKPWKRRISCQPDKRPGTGTEENQFPDRGLQKKSRGQAINNYKMFTEGLLCELTLDWFESISNRDYEAAWDLLASDHMIFGKQYNREDFFRYLESVHSIGLVRKAGEEDDGAGKEGYKKHWTADGFSFEILKGYGDEYEVMKSFRWKLSWTGSMPGRLQIGCRG